MVRQTLKKQFLRLVGGTDVPSAGAPEPEKRPTTSHVISYGRRTAMGRRAGVSGHPLEQAGEPVSYPVENDTYSDADAETVAKRAALRPKVLENLDRMYGEGSPEATSVRYGPIDSKEVGDSDNYAPVRDSEITGVRMLGASKLMNGYTLAGYIEAAGGALYIGDLKDGNLGDQVREVKKLVESGKFGFIHFPGRKNLEEITAGYRECYDTESPNRTKEEFKRMAAYKKDLGTGLIYIRGSKSLKFQMGRAIHHSNIQGGYGIEYGTVSSVTEAFMREGKGRKHAIGLALAGLTRGVEEGMIVKAEADDVIVHMGEETTYRELFGIKEGETLYFPHVTGGGKGKDNTRAIMQGLGEIPGEGPLVH